MKLTSYELSRFNRQVNTNTGPNRCWLWTGCKTKAGYGQISLKRRGKWKPYYAHRIVCCLNHGLSMEDSSTKACHRCDNPARCNPRHLFVGTQLVNVTDAIEKGRLDNRGERNGKALLTTDQVREIRKRYVRGEVTYKDLAKFYGVSHLTVKWIVLGRSWKHLL